MSSARRMKEVLQLRDEGRAAALSGARRSYPHKYGPTNGYQWLRGFDEAVAEQNADVKCRIAEEQERRDAFIDWLMRKFPWDQ